MHSRTAGAFVKQVNLLRMIKLWKLYCRLSLIA